MKAFSYSPAPTAAEASNEKDSRAEFFAGGTDLLTRMKLNIVSPDALIDLKSADLPNGVSEQNGGLTIGALTTLRDIEQSELIAEKFPVLAQAAALAATPQIRNRATVAGNLLQRPRCWYYRNRHVDCWLKGGSDCPAATGQNQQHAIFDQSPCKAVHTSDLAPALVALNARVKVRGADGERELSIEDFFAPPTEDRRRETTLADDDVVLSIELPSDASHSVYLKAMDRKVWAFALVSVAAIKSAEGWAVVLGGVANNPVRLGPLEKALENTDASDHNALDKQHDKAFADAEPLEHNGYKVTLAKRLIRRAIEQLSD